MSFVVTVESFALMDVHSCVANVLLARVTVEAQLGLQPLLCICIRLVSHCFIWYRETNSHLPYAKFLPNVMVQPS